MEANDDAESPARLRRLPLLILKAIARHSPCSELQLLDAFSRLGFSATVVLSRLDELKERGSVKVVAGQIAITDVGLHFLTHPATTRGLPHLRVISGNAANAVRAECPPDYSLDMDYSDVSVGEADASAELVSLEVPVLPSAGRDAWERTGAALVADACVAETNYEAASAVPEAEPAVATAQADSETIPMPRVDWLEEDLGCIKSSAGVLLENIPRRMRAHVPREVEIRVSRVMTPQLGLGLVGAGKTDTHPFEIATAMSLRLSAPTGRFTIEAESPETQWVERAGQSTNADFAAWRFTLIPQRRGSHILRLTFSYREVGEEGVIAESILPDRIFHVVVSTNMTKTCIQAAVWGATLVAGAALGAYFQPGVQFIARLYH